MEDHNNKNSVENTDKFWADYFQSYYRIVGTSEHLSR